MIDQARLAESLGQLDAGTRALLDLSLRRAIPDEQVAEVLGVEPSSIPPRRARGIAQLADMMDVPGPSELAALLIAIPELPEEAWGVPAPAPFAGNISRARRAKAFRRVAVAASPLVALGAVIAAVAVSSSADHSGGGSGSGAAQRGGGAAKAPATASAPKGNGGAPSGSKLAAAKPKAGRHAARKAHHASRHHRKRHGSGAGSGALLAREPVHAHAAPEHSVPVAFHPAPVAPEQPQHVTHHNAPLVHPKKPSVKPVKPVKPVPAPAPVHTPAPVSAPVTQTVQTVQQVTAPVTQTVHSVTSPNKPPKPQVPQPSLTPPGQGSGGDDDDQGNCGDRGGHGGDSHSWHHGSQPAAHPQGGGKPFTPPGLFRRRHH